MRAACVVSLKGMRRVGAEDERCLKEDLVQLPGAGVIQVERIASLGTAVGVLVREPEAEELRRPEREVWLYRPFPTGILGVLRPVVANPAGPSASAHDLETRVPATQTSLVIVS